MKIRCINKGRSFCFTEGKEYEFKNGNVISDTGNVYFYKDKTAKTIEEINGLFSYKYNNFGLEFEEVKETFTKSDLKTGDIILRRNNDVEILVNETLVRQKGFNLLRDIDDNLNSYYSQMKDIIQVRRPILHSDISFMAFEHEKGELIFNREKLNLWNGMTLEEAHRKLWNMLADNVNLCKIEALSILNINKEKLPINHCFACECCENNCDKCPICVRSGECLNGLYFNWYDAEGYKKASLAHQIANLEWKEK